MNPVRLSPPTKKPGRVPWALLGRRIRVRNMHAYVSAGWMVRVDVEGLEGGMQIKTYLQNFPLQSVWKLITRGLHDVSAVFPAAFVVLTLYMLRLEDASEIPYMRLIDKDVIDRHGQSRFFDEVHHKMIRAQRGWIRRVDVAGTLANVENDSDAESVEVAESDIESEVSSDLSR